MREVPGGGPKLAIGTACKAFGVAPRVPKGSFREAAGRAAILASMSCCLLATSSSFAVRPGKAAVMVCSWEAKVAVVARFGLGGCEAVPVILAVPAFGTS